MPSTRATSSGEDEMYAQRFPESGDFLGPSTSSSSFTWMVWHRQTARKNSSSLSYKYSTNPQLYGTPTQNKETKQKTVNNNAGPAALGVRES